MTLDLGIKVPEEDIAPEGDASRGAMLPVPKGFKILVTLPDLEEKTDGGVYLPDKLREMEQTASVAAFVLEMGDMAYLDEKKFPTGPWCKKGDWVLLRQYSGTRIKIFGKEFRLINDDTVEAVVDDPRGIRRA